MTITKIIRPERQLSTEDLNKYFCCCLTDGIPGYESGNHRDFCTSNQSNNVINGYAWNQYLTEGDSKLYYKNVKKTSKPEQLRSVLKLQIINLLHTI